MPTEFALFSALPTELREETWNLAIRPNKPGVHIFRVYGTFHGHRTLPQDVVHFSTDGYFFRGRSRDELGLALPRPDNGLTCPNKPSANSISTYVIDTGLWTACHESRSVIKKAFLAVTDVPRWDRKYVNKSMTGYHLFEGVPTYFAVRPQIDLFLLRPDSTDFTIHCIDEALCHDFAHIGFEYQSEWGRQLYEDDHNRGECLAFDQIAYLSSNASWPCIWLVDYNLKRLMEVDFLDEDSRKYWEYIEPVPDGEYRKSSLYFAESLHSYYEQTRAEEPEALFNPGIYLLRWDKTGEGHYISGGAPLYITIRYREDLVILQFDSLDFEDWDAETEVCLDDLRNIGIEYRPDWGIDLYKEEERIIDASEDDAFDKIYEFGQIVDRTRVWIIDHNLRRKADAPPCDEKRGRELFSCENISFYAADRKFSSTGLEKGGERLAHWEYINPVADGEYRNSSLYFADRLHDCYDKRLDSTARGSGTVLELLGWNRL
ncbi:hypothetical protein FPCIR_5604 [Fusarium pseudocircinatum]|uniref:2EXR domain-containing protein n=1 Tax=Fusarium pseudocircinatum TaxID=56676 RepID=A0A8H5ULP6_9HYPO|nr:hypothetical protein FPCIR_5604 [Fusarium pseudocircinatum]